MKGKTSSGFEYVVDDALFDDMEFFEVYTKWLRNGIYLPDVITMALGEDQKAKLYDCIRDKKSGKVQTRKAAEAMNEIFMAMASAGEAVKN